MRKSKRVEHGVDILHANAVEENIGGRVVTDGDHHGGEIAKRNSRDARSEAAHDIAVRNQVRGPHGVKIGQLQLALLRLKIEIRKHCNFDGTGLRKDLVGTNKNVIAGRDVFDGNAHDAVEMCINVLNRGLELLPQNPLLLRRRFYRDGRRLSEGRGQQYDDTDELFQGGSLLRAKEVGLNESKAVIQESVY